MNVLVANAGSSSLKLRLLDDGDGLLASADLPASGTSPDRPSLQRFVSTAGRADAVGHRLVHGGAEFRESVLVDEAVRGRLASVSELAPLHNGPPLAVLAELRRICPQVPHVACFDTAFHASLPAEAALYALPWDWIG